MVIRDNQYRVELTSEEGRDAIPSGSEFSWWPKMQTLVKHIDILVM